MSTRLLPLVVDNFGGGLVTNRANTSLAFGNGTPTEALDLDNCVILPGGRGFKKRNGNTKHNASALNSGANIQGLGYYRQDDQDEFMLAVAGAKLYSDAGLTGTFSDVTGSLTITNAQNAIWDIIVFNNIAYGFGGSITAPDAPWKYTGSGNGTVLGGSPPSAYAAFELNNRVFAYRTATNPSRIFWSILNSGEDWTGTGSGNSDVEASDGDALVAHSILSTDRVLLFKEESIHVMQTRSAPFPVFPLFRNDDRSAGIGAAGKHCVVTVDGAAYFVSSNARVYVTDGSDVQALDPLGDIDDIFDGLNQSRLKYIEGFYMKGRNFRWIVWMCSNGSSSSNNYAIIWDLNNKCWLRCSSGFPGNVARTTQAGTAYFGGYAGFIFKADVTNVFTDASNSTSPVSMSWRSGWFGNTNLLTATQFRKAILSLKSQSTGTLTVNFGYDFSPNSVTAQIDQEAPGDEYDVGEYDTAVWGEQTDLIREGEPLGRGNVFQVAFSNKTPEDCQVNSFSLLYKQTEQKNFFAS